MSDAAWAAIAAVLSALALAVSTLGVARINATKTDVGAAKQQAAAANTAAVAANSAAVQARDYAAPTGANGFVEHMKAALDRIERRQEAETIANRKVAELLAEHLGDHARAGGINAPPRRGRLFR